MERPQEMEAESSSGFFGRSAQPGFEGRGPNRGFRVEFSKRFRRQSPRY